MSDCILRSSAAVVIAVAAFLGAAAATAQDLPQRGPLPGIAATPPVPPRSTPNLQTSPMIASSPIVQAYIAGLQRALPSHGYHPGPETGQLDAATAAAIEDYQRDAGLPLDNRSPMSLKTTLDSVDFVRPPIMAH